MNLLLDTHALFWALYRPDLLSEVASRAVSDSDNKTWVTTTSAQEIALKLSLGKWPAALDLLLHFETRVRTANYGSIVPGARDYANIVYLPDVPGHRDPFDRFIIAQAVARGMTLVTSDPYAAHYPVFVLFAGRGERSSEPRGGRIVPEGPLTLLPFPES